MLMSSVLDIYNTLIRIESNNHITKRTKYSKDQRYKYYRLKVIELKSIIRKIDMTKPKYIIYEISYQLYNNVECYLFTFRVFKNKTYHLPNRVFQFHQPNYLIKGEKVK